MGKNAKEESFWSSFSRKACGEPQSAKLTVERQSLRIKAQKRRGNNAINSTANSRPIGRGNIGIQSVDKTNVHALSASVNYCRARNQRRQPQPTQSLFFDGSPEVAADAVAAEGRKLAKLYPEKPNHRSARKTPHSEHKKQAGR